MHNIKIFNSETYPLSILELKESLKNMPMSILDELKTNNLHDYLNEAIWNYDSPISHLHKSITQALMVHNIVCYHNTRITNKNTILDKGLIFSDSRYIDILTNDMLEANINKSLIKEVLDAVEQEINRHTLEGKNKRRNAICFFYDLGYYKEYDMFLASYGGEFVEFGLSAISQNNSLEKYKEILKLGKPYIVEFLIPFKWLDEIIQEKIGVFLIKEWTNLEIIKEEPSHEYDGWIEREIPSKFIVGIYEVKDYFPDIDDHLFR